MKVTCIKCGYSRTSSARTPKSIRFKCPKCGSKSFEWSR